MSKYDDMFLRAAASIPWDIDERRTAYNRMRKALAARLRDADPPIPQAVIDDELAELEAAIQRLEVDLSRAHLAPLRKGNFAGTANTPWFRRRAATLARIGIVFALVIAGMAGAYSVLTSGQQTPVRVGKLSDASHDTSRSAPRDAQSIPYIYMRQLVPYRTSHPAGTVIIDKTQLYLYVLQPKVSAIRYGISVGGSCASVAGLYQVNRKIESNDPRRVVRTDFRDALAAREIADARRTIYLDSDVHTIQGTGTATSIGRAVRNGCFQVIERDFADLFDRVSDGARVVVN